MILFPRFVFKNGGPEQRAGGTYSHKLVNDQEEMDAALAEEWSATLPEAIEGRQPIPEAHPVVLVHTEEIAPLETIPEDDAPPTRAELEAKCTELGLKFDRRMSDKTLSKLIDKALEG